MGYKAPVDPRRHSESVDQGMNGQAMKFHTFSDRNVRRGGYTRKSVPGNFSVNSYLLIYFVYFCFVLVNNLIINLLDKVL